MTTIPELVAALAGGDTPQDAVSDARCLLPPIGCGRPLTASDLPTDVAAREWRISGLCPGCFDVAVSGGGGLPDGQCADCVADTYIADVHAAIDRRGTASSAEQRHLLDPNNRQSTVSPLDHPGRCHTAAHDPTRTTGETT